VREKALQITFVFLLLIGTTIGGIDVRTASGSAVPVISVDPPTNTAEPGGNFTVNIIVADIAESESLYGWEVEITFDPNILNTSRGDVVKGPFLRDAVSPYGYTTLFVKEVDNLMGVVKVGETVSPKVPPDDPYPPVGATGNGTLATITFHVKAVGASLLHLEEDGHFLFTVIADNVVEIMHEVIDGVFDNREPSTITINASPSTIKPGQTITITGSIIPTKIGVNVTIRYRQGGTLDWIDITTVLTNETSQYSYDWTPTTLLGTYELISSWEGDATNSGAESSPIAVVISFQPPIALFSFEPLEPPLVGEIVTFNATESKDPDGDIVSYAWDFGDNTTSTGNVTTHSYAAAGIYSVTLTVTDDDNQNDTATDDVIVLGHNIAIISVVPSPTTVKIGESVSIVVTVTNEGNFTETFNVTAYYADTPIETQTGITLTGGNSTTLTFNWNTVEVAVGNYTIKAVASHVENETDTGDNTRTDGTVTVKQSSQITISVDPSTIRVGQNTDISGTITPTRAGATVTIQYRPAEGDWSILETVTSDTNGKYVYEWSPETSGTYEVKAGWEGDATHMGAESNVASVKIREATAVNIYLFAVAGVGIVIVAAIALYFLRARKRKSV
jgi:PKD repeat protein